MTIGTTGSNAYVAPRLRLKIFTMLAGIEKIENASSTVNVVIEHSPLVAAMIDVTRETVPQ